MTKPYWHNRHGDLANYLTVADADSEIADLCQWQQRAKLAERQRDEMMVLLGGQTNLGTCPRCKGTGKEPA